MAPVVAYVVNSSMQSYPNANLMFTFVTTGKPTKMYWDPLQGILDFLPY